MEKGIKGNKRSTCIYKGSMGKQKEKWEIKWLWMGNKTSNTHSMNFQLYTFNMKSPQCLLCGLQVECVPAPSFIAQCFLTCFYTYSMGCILSAVMEIRCGVKVSIPASKFLFQLPLTAVLLLIQLEQKTYLQKFLCFYFAGTCFIFSKKCTAYEHACA